MEGLVKLELLKYLATIVAENTAVAQSKLGITSADIVKGEWYLLRCNH